MKYLIYLILLLTPCCLVAQNLNVDSLLKVTELTSNDSIKSNHYFLISNYYRTVKIDYPKAIFYAEKSIQNAQNIPSDFAITRSLIALGFSTRENGKPNDAIVHLKKAIHIFETSQTLPNVSSIYQNHITCHTSIAEIYGNTQDFKNAESHAFQALAISEKYNTSVGLSLMSLSVIFSQQLNTAEARKYALKALEEFKKINSPNNIARAYSYLAKYDYGDDDLASAVKNYQNALEQYRKTENNAYIKGTLYNLAQCYVKLNENDKAEYYINEVYKFTNPVQDAVFISFLNKFSYNLSMNKKNYKAALALCKDILEFAQKEKSFVNIGIAYEKYIHAYVALKDTANAYLMSEKLNAIKDSIYKFNISKNTAELAKKYETEKQQQQITLLDKESKLTQEKLKQEQLVAAALKVENQLKQAKLNEQNLVSSLLEKENAIKDFEIEQKQFIQNALIKENQLKKNELKQEKRLSQSLQKQNAISAINSENEKRIRWLMLFCLIVLLAFVFSYYKSYRTQKIANAKIVKQSNAMQVLVKEVHHRVKNNLQVVMAMLRMQERSILDENAKDALIHSENRLQAIAIIHEKLYNTNDFTAVALKEYVEDLMKVLVVQYQSMHPNFSYSIEDNAHLVTNLDTAIPVGMIVNELVTNSFKHAFNNVDKAIIQIAINATSNQTYQLVIQDNGIGFTNHQNPQSLQNGLGLKLVHLFVEQLNGNLKYTSTNGSNFTITFQYPLAKL